MAFIIAMTPLARIEIPEASAASYISPS